MTPAILTGGVGEREERSPRVKRRKDERGRERPNPSWLTDFSNISYPKEEP